MTWRSAHGTPYPEVDHLQHGGGWLGLLSEGVQRRIGTALAALPLAMEIETPSGLVGLVHADCPFDDWREMQAVPWEEVDATGRLGKCCLWSLDRYEQHYAGHVSNVRAVVHGHRVVRSAEILGNVHFIDTGGWKPGGHFTFLELETLEPVCGPALPQVAINRRNR